MSETVSASVLNVFRQDAFSTTSLTTMIERNPYLPNGIGALGIFEPEYIMTKDVMIEQFNGALQIIPVTARGAPPTERVTEKRNARPFRTQRLAHGDTISVSEIQDVIGFGNVPGSPRALMNMQTEVARRLKGPTGILSNIEYTKERMRLGALQGLLKDKNDSTIYNFYNEFGITPSPEVVMNFAAGLTGTLRPLADRIRRGVMRAGAGSIVEATEIVALCGDTFFDLFTNHPDVRQTFLNYQAAPQLLQGNAFGTFRAYDITWINYRGSDDLSTISIPTNKAVFFPRGAPGVFKVAYAPGESEAWANQPGKPEYVLTFPDRDRAMFERIEAYSYPLYICTRPEVIWTATADAYAD